MSHNARHARSSMSRASGSFSDRSGVVALVATTLIVTGCAVYGGASSARIRGDTVTMSSASARIDPHGVSARSDRHVQELGPVR
jgi:hypothetical protein